MITGAVTAVTEAASAIGQETCTDASGSVLGQPGQQSKSEVSIAAAVSPLENVFVLAEKTHGSLFFNYVDILCASYDGAL